MAELTRKRLRRAVGGLVAIGGLAVVGVLLDSAIDFRPPGIHDSYRFTLAELEFDRPVILRSDNLAIVVIRRSKISIEALRAAGESLWDPQSRDSRQPAGLQNALRSRHEEFYVGYATGTDFGCEVTVDAGTLREICGSARYDFAGRALRGETEYSNLPIPEYAFSADFKRLVIKP